MLDERGVIDPAAVEARARELAALPPGHDQDDHHDTDSAGTEGVSQGVCLRGEVGTRAPASSTVQQQVE